MVTSSFTTMSSVLTNMYRHRHDADAPEPHAVVPPPSASHLMRGGGVIDTDGWTADKNKMTGRL
jgi:hypothetical protein